MKGLMIKHETDARRTTQDGQNKDNLKKDEWNQEFKKEGNFQMRNRKGVERSYRPKVFHIGNYTTEGQTD